VRLNSHIDGIVGGFTASHIQGKAVEISNSPKSQS